MWFMEKLPSGCAPAGAASAANATTRISRRRLIAAPPVPAAPATAACRGRAPARSAAAAAARRRARPSRRGTRTADRPTRAAARAAPSAARPRGRPLRVSAQPTASAERTLGAAAHARRASRSPRAGCPWSLSNTASSVSVLTPARASSRCCTRTSARSCRAARTRPAASSASPRPMAYSGSGSRATRRSIEANGGAQPAFVRRQPRAAGLRGRVLRRLAQRSPVGRARLRRPAADQREVAAQHLDRGGVLGRRPSGRRGEIERARRPGEVAVQLAQVGHPRVGREVGLQVRQPLQRAAGVAVAAELDERVDRHRQRGQPGLRAAGEPQPAREVVAREREAAEGDERVGVARLACQHAAQQQLGALVEGDVAGLPHALQVLARQRDARCARRRCAADRGLQPRDLTERAAGRGAHLAEVRGGDRDGGLAPAERQHDQAARKAAPRASASAAKRGVHEGHESSPSGASAGPRSVRPRLVPRGLRPAAAAPARAPAPSAWSGR